MATRSAIGIEVDGKVVGVYCHWDGYLDGVGATLAKHYTSAESVRALVSQGGISSLGETVEATTFYARDRGEEVTIREFPNENEFFFNFDTGTEFRYLWTSEGWRVYEVYDKDFQMLAFEGEKVKALRERVQKQVDLCRKYADEGDDEAAHVTQKGIYEMVLEAVAEGLLEADECAKLALETRNFDFRPW